MANNEDLEVPAAPTAHARYQAAAPAMNNNLETQSNMETHSNANNSVANLSATNMSEYTVNTTMSANTSAS